MNKQKIIISIHAQSIYNDFADDLDHYFARSQTVQIRATDKNIEKTIIFIETYIQEGKAKYQSFNTRINQKKEGYAIPQISAVIQRTNNKSQINDKKTQFVQKRKESTIEQNNIKSKSNKQEKQHQQKAKKTKYVEKEATNRRQ